MEGAQTVPEHGSLSIGEVFGQVLYAASSDDESLATYAAAGGCFYPSAPLPDYRPNSLRWHATLQKFAAICADSVKIFNVSSTSFEEVLLPPFAERIVDLHWHPLLPRSLFVLTEACLHMISFGTDGYTHQKLAHAVAGQRFVACDVSGFLVALLATDGLVLLDASGLESPVSIRSSILASSTKDPTAALPQYAGGILFSPAGDCLAVAVGYRLVFFVFDAAVGAWRQYAFLPLENSVSAMCFDASGSLFFYACNGAACVNVMQMGQGLGADQRGPQFLTRIAMDPVEVSWERPSGVSAYPNVVVGGSVSFLACSKSRLIVGFSGRDETTAAYLALVGMDQTPTVRFYWKGWLQTAAGAVSASFWRPFPRGDLAALVLRDRAVFIPFLEHS